MKYHIQIINLTRQKKAFICMNMGIIGKVKNFFPYTCQ